MARPVLSMPDQRAGPLPDSAWELGSAPLRFQLGDIVLGELTLSLLRRNAALDERPLDIDDTPVPPPPLDGAQGYVVWSHPIARRLPSLSVRRGKILYVPRQYRRFFVEFSGSFTEYLTAFSAKTRSGLRRKLRKFAEASGGAVDWREYRTPEQMAAFLPLARQVSAKTYQERFLRMGLPADDEFVSSALALSAADALRAYLLFLNGEPVSYLYCPVRRGVVIYDRLGYDPACAALSPGTVLQLLALESLFAEQRFAAFDFTEGEGQHKELFSTSSRLCADVYVVNQRLVSFSAVMFHYAVDKSATAAGIVLDRLRLKSPLRRLVRGL